MDEVSNIFSARVFNQLRVGTATIESSYCLTSWQRWVLQPVQLYFRAPCQRPCDLKVSRPPDGISPANIKNKSSIRVVGLGSCSAVLLKRKCILTQFAVCATGNVLASATSEFPPNLHCPFSARKFWSPIPDDKSYDQ